ncbi:MULTISPECIES: hypothetical protein [Paenibacillus]|nr:MULTISPECIES: hypothetical protein [Paenibacillus]
MNWTLFTFNGMRTPWGFVEVSPTAPASGGERSLAPEREYPTGTN